MGNGFEGRPISFRPSWVLSKGETFGRTRGKEGRGRKSCRGFRCHEGRSMRWFLFVLLTLHPSFRLLHFPLGSVRERSHGNASILFPSRQGTNGRGRDREVRSIPLRFGSECASERPRRFHDSILSNHRIVGREEGRRFGSFDRDSIVSIGKRNRANPSFVHPLSRVPSDASETTRWMLVSFRSMRLRLCNPSMGRYKMRERSLLSSVEGGTTNSISTTSESKNLHFLSCIFGCNYHVVAIDGTCPFSC